MLLLCTAKAIKARVLEDGTLLDVVTVCSPENHMFLNYMDVGADLKNEDCSDH
jgi:hypothetical protein